MNEGMMQAVLIEAIEGAGFDGELMQEADSNSMTLQIEGLNVQICACDIIK